MHLSSVTAAVLATLLLPLVTVAQAPRHGGRTEAPTAPTSSDDATAAAPDVVRTTDGGVFRGMLIEYIPNDHATIRLVDGRDRTIPGASIVFAGPTSLDPATTSASPDGSRPSRPPTPAGERETARSTEAPSAAPPAVELVHFRAQRSGLTIHRRAARLSLGPWEGDGSRDTAIGAFVEVCTAPCSVALSPRRLSLAVSFQDRDPVLVEGPVAIVPGRTYRVDYRDRQAVRRAGAILGSLAFVSGLGLLIGGGMRSTCSDSASDCPGVTGLLVSGGVLAIGGLVTGFAMTSRRDVATIGLPSIRF